MCRLLGYCSRDAASVAELLGEESLGAFTSLSDLHGDGWGMAWYAGSRPATWKSPARAGREPEYDKLAWQPLGDLGLVHLRWATPGLAVSDANTHPFCYEAYTFAHNGAIYPQDRLGEMLPPGWERQLVGSTDSERYFLHLMSRLAARDGNMVAAIADTTADISQRYTASSLNAILLAPDALYAISFYDRSKVPAEMLRQVGHGDRPEEVAAYFDLAYRATSDSVIVASSGWPMPGWTPLPSGHVLVTDRRTLATSVLPITASLPACRCPPNAALATRDGSRRTTRPGRSPPGRDAVTGSHDVRRADVPVDHPPLVHPRHRPGQPQPETDRCHRQPPSRAALLDELLLGGCPLGRFGAIDRLPSALTSRSTRASDWPRVSSCARVLQHRLVISESEGVARFARGCLTASSPVRPLQVESLGVGDVDVQVEHRAPQDETGPSFPEGEHETAACASSREPPVGFRGLAVDAPILVIEPARDQEALPSTRRVTLTQAGDSGGGPERTCCWKCSLSSSSAWKIPARVSNLRNTVPLPRPARSARGVHGQFVRPLFGENLPGHGQQLTPVARRVSALGLRGAQDQSELGHGIHSRAGI
jgi:predicted glutamine amidotransferase